jgi:hypothetical protein
LLSMGAGIVCISVIDHKVTMRQSAVNA